MSTPPAPDEKEDSFLFCRADIFVIVMSLSAAVRVEKKLIGDEMDEVDDDEEEEEEVRGDGALGFSLFLKLNICG